MVGRITLFGCQVTLVIVERCFFLINLLTHLHTITTPHSLHINRMDMYINSNALE